VLGDPLRSTVQRLRGNNPRLTSPGHVGHFIDVTVGACEIATAVQLYDELPEWPWRPTVAEQ
jgi:hypothetical protein